jgi:hypothetical protein
VNTSFRTCLPHRHASLFSLRGVDPEVQTATFQSRVPVRPARLVFQGHVKPRSADLAWEIHAMAKEVAYFPFVYRGWVSGATDDGGNVPVKLWEEPSGRPLEAELPLDWFKERLPFKGMPFRLVTWMTVAPTGKLISDRNIESLTPLQGVRGGAPKGEPTRGEGGES